MSQSSATPVQGTNVDLDGLLCALVLVPRSFARNRFFALYENPRARQVRRRAARVRTIVRSLLGEGRERAEITGEQVLEDGRVVLRYRLGRLALSHTMSLSALEASVLRFALHRGAGQPLSAGDRDAVETAIARLGKDLDLGERP